jgi:prepilin-type N-terminal cleavage/methylation domain-containing protein
MNSIQRTAERLAAKRNQEDGFTLIELLVVIVILGTLSAVVVFSVGSVTNRGTQAACKSDAKTLEVAVEAYRAQNNAYPAADFAGLTPGYIRTIPVDTHYDYNALSGAVTPTC